MYYSDILLIFGRGLFEFRTSAFSVRCVALNHYMISSAHNLIVSWVGTLKIIGDEGSKIKLTSFQSLRIVLIIIMMQEWREQGIKGSKV